MKNREIRMQFEKYLETIGKTHKTLHSYIGFAHDFSKVCEIYANLEFLNQIIFVADVLNSKCKGGAKYANFYLRTCIRKYNTNWV